MEFDYGDYYYDFEEKVLRIRDGVKIISQDMFSRFHDQQNSRLYGERDFKVIIPNSVEKIEFKGFFDMRVSEYQIPNSVKEISQDAFGCNDHLKSMQWPSSVKIIQSCVLDCCRSLEEVVLPEGLEVIQYSAFGFDSSLTTITIPTTVKKIDENAFQYCGLRSISVPDNIEKIERETFYECSNLEIIELHEGLLEIRDGAFARCKNLTTITIPTTVESFGRGVFLYCEKLKEIYVPKALYDKYGKDYFKIDTPAEVIPYNEPMSKKAITNPKARKENAENARITSSSKKEFKSFCGTIRTNFIADKRKK